MNLASTRSDRLEPLSAFPSKASIQRDRLFAGLYSARYPASAIHRRLPSIGYPPPFLWHIHTHSYLTGEFAKVFTFLVLEERDNWNAKINAA